MGIGCISTFGETNQMKVWWNLSFERFLHFLHFWHNWHFQQNEQIINHYFLPFRKHKSWKFIWLFRLNFTFYIYTKFVVLHLSPSFLKPYYTPNMTIVSKNVILVTSRWYEDRQFSPQALEAERSLISFLWVFFRFFVSSVVQLC